MSCCINTIGLRLPLAFLFAYALAAGEARSTQFFFFLFFRRRARALRVGNAIVRVLFVLLPPHVFLCSCFVVRKAEKTSEGRAKYIDVIRTYCSPCSKLGRTAETSKNLQPVAGGISCFFYCTVVLSKQETIPGTWCIFWERRHVCT